MTNPAYTHQAIISADTPPRPACNGTGRSVACAADVTCPDCLSLAAERSARVAEPDEFAAADEADAIEASRAEEDRADVEAQADAELHDAHAIPAGDEPDHLAAFRALNPKPGQVFLDHSDRPLAVVEDHNGWYLTTLDGLNQFKPSAVGTFGPMTRAQIVPADAIVLPDHDDPVLIDNDGDRWLLMGRETVDGLLLPIERIVRDYGPVTVADAESLGTGG